MSASDFAGALRERATILRPSPEREADGAAADDWTVMAIAWAEIVPDGRGALLAGEARVGLPLWRVTLRRSDIAVGDRIEWASGTIDVREVRIDPRLPDRIVAIGEERR